MERSMDSRNHFCSVSHCCSTVTPGLGPVARPSTMRGRDRTYSGMVPAQDDVISSVAVSASAAVDSRFS